MENGLFSFDLTFLNEMLFTWLCAGIVAVVLHKLLYAPVTRVLQKRAEKIQEELSDAEKRLTEAEALKAEYQNALSGIEAKESKLINNALRRAANRERLILDEAREQAKALRMDAMLALKAERENAREEMNRQLIEISTLIAGRYAAEAIDEARKEELLENALAELGAKRWPV